MRHIANDGLPALVHRNALNNDLLLAFGPVTLKRLNLRRERPRQLVKSTLRAVLLRDGVHMGEAARECDL